VDPAQLVRGIWARDASIWTDSGEEQWLGWLDEPGRMRPRAAELVRFAEEVSEDFDDCVLLGMGGSSLAPEVLRRTFDASSLHVLDTTHPQAIRALEAQLDLERTLFVSASKSGSTLETLSHTDYFWEKTGGLAAQFVAITDPGSSLESLAQERGFRKIFHGEPTIGGRYSALSAFGMVPAALMGIEVDRLLGLAEDMAEQCRSEQDDNPGLELGLAFGHGWLHGRDKVCIKDTPGKFGLWAEQLLAESTGKEGKGLIPAPGENPNAADRQPALPLIEDPAEIGGEFFRWEFATAVAGQLLEINPFDQPNVQEAKDRTRQVLDSGDDPQLEPESTPDILFAQAQPGDYVCLQAFVDPSPDADVALFELAQRARTETGCVVTTGYGPRYLHSTGQLHKGGPPTGLFLQIVDDTGDELPIPGRPFGFGRLIRAQAAGDYASLKERGRRVARVRLEDL
jgi:transaldolase / glucose-6-phosphate isomerase